jgi:hypothetical protein
VSADPSTAVWSIIRMKRWIFKMRLGVLKFIIRISVLHS